MIFDMTGVICVTIDLIGARTDETSTPTVATCTAIDATCETTIAIANYRDARRDRRDIRNVLINPALHLAFTRDVLDARGSAAGQREYLSCRDVCRDGHAASPDDQP